MADLGSFDGQVPSHAVVKVSGSFPIHRALSQDEIVYAVVKLEVGNVEFEERHETLVRVHKGKVVTGGEPPVASKLAERLVDFIDGVSAGDQARLDLHQAAKELVDMGVEVTASYYEPGKEPF